MGARRATDRLSELEVEIVDLFVRLAAMLNLPRSIGEIYGLLFLREDPLSMDDLVERLCISKGSTSQGLRILRNFGAVKTQYVPGQRREFYVAEVELRKLAAGFLKENVQPHLESGSQRLRAARELVNGEPPERRAHLKERLDQLDRWNHRAKLMLPLALRVTNR